MRKPSNKGKQKSPPNPPAKVGVKVYYDEKTEAYLRKQAQDQGFRNVQEYLKFQARRARLAAEGSDD